MVLAGIGGLSGCCGESLLGKLLKEPRPAGRYQSG